ncbi:unnamed protein product [Calypogeia fissa]
MVLQLSKGLLQLGDGSLVLRLGNQYVQRHGFFGSRNVVKVTLGSGRRSGPENCIARVSRAEFSFGRSNLNGWHQCQRQIQLQVQQRTHLRVVSSSLRNGAGGEEELESPARRSVHFIGIGGAGLSALAFLALKQGWQVSGSDATASDRTKELAAAGATVYIGHASSHVLNPSGQSGPPDAVVVSSAVPRNSEEVQAARNAGLPIYKRADWLGKITEGYDVLAIAGSHGKSTTAAMLATILDKLGDDITAVVGAEVPQFPGGRNAICGQGKNFVLEADEYDGCFLGVTPALAVVTNVEWEHVDIFPNEASVREIFKKFVLRIRPGGTLIVCGDGAGSKLQGTVFKEGLHRVVTYGLDKGNDWQAVMLNPNVQGGTDYVAVHAGRPMARVSLRIPGTYNVLNSLAALVAASIVRSQEVIGGDQGDGLVAVQRVAEAASRVLAQFVGVRRRFEFVGEVKGCVIIDDYAHHPTAVRAVLQAARQRFDGYSIWVVFQPHTYSRLVSLLQDFAPAFSAADRVIVTEVYSAREENVWNISGADLAASIIGPPAIFISSLDEVVERLSWELTVYESMKGQSQGRVVLLTLGAGDITNVGSQLLRAFQATPR